jgi:hypothetical protein
MRFKILGQEVALPTTANTATSLNSAVEVRLVHDLGGNATQLVTITDGEASPTTVGSFSITPGESLVIRKLPTQKIYASTDDVRAVAVSYIS